VFEADQATKRTGGSMVVPKTKSEYQYVKDQIKNPQEIDKYPHLNAFIERGMGTRFHKKTKFIYDNKQTINNHVIGQIHEKDEKLLSEKVDNILQERALLKENKRQMVQDNYYEATDKLLKKLEFVTVNDKLK
jgi:hypothetical protein